MRTLRQKFDLFCYRNSGKGIPNLMLWIAIGNLFVYFMTQIDPSAVIYQFLRFDKTAILHGQVWRLLTYILIPSFGSLLSLAIMMFFYFQIGRILEGSWGTLKFNLYYLTGIVLADLCAMVLPGGVATTYYLNLSLILAFASLYPDNQVLLFFIIPIKMKYMALFSGALCLIDLLMGGWSTREAVLLSLANFLLFFGGDFFRTVKQEIKYHKTRRTWQNQNRSNWR